VYIYFDIYNKKSQGILGWGGRIRFFLAARVGFEPTLSPPEGDALPLGYRAMIVNKENFDVPPMAGCLTAWLLLNVVGIIIFIGKTAKKFRC
jgi:hypothetical protein